VFGMGTGGTLSLQSPKIVLISLAQRANACATYSPQKSRLVFGAQAL
jgi:hypothetical protein